MEIQIITKKVQGLIHPFAIFARTTTKWVLQVKIKNFTGQEKINYTWSLRSGQKYPQTVIGSTKELKIQPEQILKWSFKPYQSGEQRLELIIDGLDHQKDKVLDDYGSQILIQQNKLPLLSYSVIYGWVFEVQKYRDIFLFWFAIVSTIGAIFEILSYFLPRA